MCADGSVMTGTPAAGTCGVCPKGSFSNAIALASAAYASFSTLRSFLPGPWNANCTPCPEGTYSPAGPGAASCTSPTLQCPQGSYCPPGSAIPIPCPLNTYSNAPSATSNVCQPCPATYITLSTGSTSCISTGGAAFACPTGTQPRSAAPPASAADCAPLACAAHLNLTASACVGCGGGSFGGAGACAPCPAGLLCPGLMATPLLNFSASASASASGPPAAPPACALLTLPPAPAAAAEPAAALDPTTTAGYIGIGVAGALFAFPLALAAFACYHVKSLREKVVTAGEASGASAKKVAARLAAWSASSSRMQTLIAYLDIVSPTQPMMVGRVGQTLAPTRLMGERKKSCLGFSTSLLGIGGLAIIAAVLGVKRQTANTLAQSSLVVLQSSLLAASSAWPWATAAAPGVGGKVSGVLVRVTASGGVPGECSAPIAGSLASPGLTAGAWVQLPSAASPASAPYPAAQLTFSCPACIFSGLSVLSFQLPLACQSLYIEAAAVGADGAYNTLSVPASLTAGAPGRLLSSVLWQLTPLLDLRNDTLTPSNNARGWQMIAKDSSSTLSAPGGAGGGLLGVQPLAAPISITINFILQPFASVLGPCGCLRAGQAHCPFPLLPFYPSPPLSTPPTFPAALLSRSLSCSPS